MREMLSVILDGEMEAELGYSKYDFRNKDTDNSRMAITLRPCIPAMETWRKKSFLCMPKA